MCDDPPGPIKRFRRKPWPRLVVLYKTPTDPAAFDKHYAENSHSAREKNSGAAQIRDQPRTGRVAWRTVRRSSRRDPAFRRHGGDPACFRVARGDCDGGGRAEDRDRRSRHADVRPSRSVSRALGLADRVTRSIEARRFRASPRRASSSGWRARLAPSPRARRRHRTPAERASLVGVSFARTSSGRGQRSMRLRG